MAAAAVEHSPAGVASPARSFRNLMARAGSKREADSTAVISFQEQVLVLILFFVLLVTYLAAWAGIYIAANPQSFVSETINSTHVLTLQDTTYLDAMYFSIITFTTVGLGDVVPASDPGKIFVTVFILVSMTVAAIGVDVTNFVFHLNHSADEDEDDIYDPAKDTVFRNAAYLTPAHWRLVLAVGLILFNLVVGVLWLAFVEEFSFVDALYFATAVLTTVGYGDILPTTRSWKIFAIFWMSSGTFALFRALGAVMGVALAARKVRWRDAMRKRRANLRGEMRRSLERDGVVGNLVRNDVAEVENARRVSLTKFEEMDARLTEQEFVLYELERNGIATPAQINEITAHFEAFRSENL